MPLLLPQRPELHHAVGPWLPVRLFAAAALTVVNFVTAQMGSSTETTTPFSVEEYGMVGATGFDNAYYQAYQYRGSRILEHGSVAYRSFRWTQSGDVSSDGWCWNWRQTRRGQAQPMSPGQRNIVCLVAPTGDQVTLMASTPSLFSTDLWAFRLGKLEFTSRTLATMLCAS
ncbi:unnamed protein product [Amoebophrya sp. A25]|nr:unnamed protein product [Amoebophrya sp. A25]|eukprot:GSA25T00021088001.1